MSFLFDQNLSYKLVERLDDLYSNSTHVGHHNLSKSDDFKVREFAIQNELIIVTQDSDFYDLAIIKGIPPKIIWIRSGNCSTSNIEQLIRSNTSAIEDFIKENNSICLELF